MTDQEESIYPKLKKAFTERELRTFFTPTADEIAYVKQQTRQPTPRLGLLILIKVVSYLHYFPKIQSIPYQVIAHIGLNAGNWHATKKALIQYESSGTRRRHSHLVREYLSLKLFEKARDDIYQHCLTFAKTKAHFSDIINATLEQLIQDNIELPAFSVLEKLAYHARSKVNTTYQQQIAKQCSKETVMKLNEMLEVLPNQPQTDWQRLKQSPKRPQPKHIEHYLKFVDWLSDWIAKIPAIDGIPVGKQEQFFDEAFSLDVSQMKEMQPNKRVTLMVILMRNQHTKALDNLAELFIKLVRNMKKSAKTKLEQYHLENTKQTDALIGRFQAVLKEFEKHSDSEENSIDTLQAVIGDDLESLLNACETHLAYANHNYLPFISKFYKSRRKLLFDCLENLDLQSHLAAAQPLLTVWEHIKQHRNAPGDTLSLNTENEALSLNWLPKLWRSQLFDDPTNPELTAVNKAYFEMAVFCEIQQALCDRECYIENADTFGDDRKRLVDWQTYNDEIEDYGKSVDLPVEASDFIHKLKNELNELSQSVDEKFPDLTDVAFEKKDLVIRRHEQRKPREKTLKLQKEIDSRLKNVSILDAITDIENWLELHKFFVPHSGFKGKLEDVKKRFITTLFCYGCNLGPSQTASSIKSFSRKQVAWLNLRYVNEKTLKKAIKKVVDTYHKMALPKYWGTGKHASADGTHWETYEQNLLSEFHFRYRLKGGVGYYVVSDQYIALFSHFITCGVHEAAYILNGVMENEMDIQPDILHGDTQAQSSVVFGLAYLLGIQLMPRIRGIKKLKFYKADPLQIYKHINTLFSDHIEWELIENHFQDMLQIALSIRKGMVKPSAILAMFGSKNKRNPVYKAFRELGRVIRTLFLLRYISDVDLRKIIQSETNKSEQYNGFLKWIFFCNHGVIEENLKMQQDKIIKYSHLLSNMLILYNTNEMTRIIEELQQEGFEFDLEDLAALAPYHYGHLNRLGSYYLNLNRKLIEVFLGKSLPKNRMQ